MSSVADALTIIAVVAASEALGWLAQRLGQPKVLGELLTGLLLGASALGILDPSRPVIATVAEIGVWVLLFEIGLETDIRALMRVGAHAATVGSVGVVVPFAAGTAAAMLFGLNWLESLMCGASLTATSIGISARVLRDVKRIDSTEGRIVLGAAVLDDIAGLALLAIVTALAGAAHVGGTGDSTKHSAIGSIVLIGSFLAGMVLHRTALRHSTERVVKVLGFVVVPVFFAAVGAAVQLRAIAGSRAIGLTVALLVIGVLGKFVAGYAPRGFTGDKALIGVAMIPRGEVGLVFASTARTLGVFNETIFSVVTLVVMATTFLTPPILARMVRRR